MATPSSKDFRFSAVTLELQDPEPHHLRIIQHQAALDRRALEKIVYRVHLHTKAPLFGNSHGYHLLIGDKRIPEYHGTDDGLFFHLHSFDSLTNLAGGRLKLALDTDDPIDTGANFPDFSKIQRQVGRRYQVRLP